jgi:uncharacterized protein (TIGR00369 family)
MAATWSAAEELCGFPGIVHGGIVTTLMDEAMSKSVARTGVRALTCELKVRLRESAHPGDALRIRGWVVERRKRRILTEATVEGPEGREVAHGWATFLVVEG